MNAGDIAFLLAAVGAVALVWLAIASFAWAVTDERHPD